MTDKQKYDSVFVLQENYLGLSLMPYFLKNLCGSLPIELTKHRR